MTETWQPLDAEDGQDYAALYGEVTSWLRPSLLSWIAEMISDRSVGAFDLLAKDRLRRLERDLRTPLGRLSSRPTVYAEPLLRAFEQGNREWVLVDYLLATSEAPDSDSFELGTLLLESGSAWTVGMRQGKPGLVKRVAEGTEDFVRHVTANRGHAGQRLAEAFSCAYGVNPDPSKAYSLAVKAVEDAAKPVVSANHGGATLGTMISQIRDSGRFKLPQTREHQDSRTHDVLLGMMRMLWVGQHDRHGGDATAPPVSQEEAETAVMVASTLVELFASGKVVK